MAKKNLPVIRIISQSESRLHLVDREKFVIGRSPEVEILLLSTSISRKHLMVEVRDQSILVEDMGSSNGSFVNDVKLEIGKKYPVPLMTPIRLGTNGDIVTIDLMERPMEFDQYHSYLPKFNYDLQGLLEQIVKEANVRADHVMKEAQSKADHYVTQAQVQAQNIIQKVRVQEDSALEIAQAKSQQVVKEAEKTAADTIEKSRQMAQSEGEALRQAAHQEAEAITKKRLEQLRVDIQNQQTQAIEKARADAEREYRMRIEENENKIREYSVSVKAKAQAEADEMLQLAYKESARVKETGVQEFEKMRSEGQLRGQTLMAEAEQQAEKIINQARETSEKMRNSARIDFDEMVERNKSMKLEAEQILQTAQKEVAGIKEMATGEAEKSRLEIQNEVIRLKAEADQIIGRAQAEAAQCKDSIIQDAEKLKADGHRKYQTAVADADQVVQNAHKEAGRVKEAGAQESERLRIEGQKRVQLMITEAEQQADKVMMHAREAADKLRQAARNDFDEVVERGKQHNQELMQNAEAEAQQLVENARKRAAFIVENQEKESAFIVQELKTRIEMETRKEALKLLRETEEQIETNKSLARQEFENFQLKKAQFDEELSLIKKEVDSADQSKKNLASQSSDLQIEITRLKEENKRQASLNEKLEELSRQIQALELQRAQLGEKNVKMEGELETLRKKTMADLERKRQEEERKVLQMASIKAREFAHRIEKIILQEVNHMLPLALNTVQINAVSKTLTEEMISLFHFESAKHNEAVSLQASDRNVAPSFMKTKWFQVGFASALIAGAFYLYKESNFAVAKQEKFTEALIEKQKEEARFKPVMTDEFRGSYTDNVIYKNKYAQMKMDSGIQDNWALNLNDFFLKDLRLSEDNMVRFIGLEAALIKKLATLRESLDSSYYEEGITRMREAESQEVEKIMAVVKSPQNFQRLRQREKIFLSQVETVEIRVPAGQVPKEIPDRSPQSIQEATPAPAPVRGKALRVPRSANGQRGIKR